MASGAVALSPRPVGTVDRARRRFVAAMIAVPLTACSRRSSVTARDFVGKWKSSRLTTPLRLEENGEWQIVQDDGSVLQRGVWQYLDHAILWSYKVDGEIGHDKNAVLSVSPGKFELRERDGSTTTFVRLD